MNMRILGLLVLALVTSLIADYATTLVSFGNLPTVVPAVIALAVVATSIAWVCSHFFEFGNCPWQAVATINGLVSGLRLFVVFMIASAVSIPILSWVVLAIASYASAWIISEIQKNAPGPVATGTGPRLSI